MDEYIEREAAIKAIYESDHFSVRECFGWRAREIEEELRAIPAVDVAPVRHGRWLNNDIPDSILSKCSECGILYGSCAFNYCPNCGARMDGAE